MAIFICTTFYVFAVIFFKNINMDIVGVLFPCNQVKGIVMSEYVVKVKYYGVGVHSDQ